MMNIIKLNVYCNIHVIYKFLPILELPDISPRIFDALETVQCPMTSVRLAPEPEPELCVH